MSPSLYSVSHASTIIDDGQQLDSNPANTDLDAKVDPYLVQFDQNDPSNPKVLFFSGAPRSFLTFYSFQNWSNLKRWYITFIGGLLVLNA